MIHRLLPWIAFLAAVALFVTLIYEAKADVPANVQRWRADVILHVEVVYGHTRFAALHGAVVERESGGRPGVGSPAGAVGLGQFMLPTWKEMVRMYPQFGNDRRDPNASIALMVRYLQRLTGMCAIRPVGCQRWQCALGAYNGGIGRAIKRITRYGDAWLAHMSAETRHYVPTILKREPVFIANNWPGASPCLN